MSASSGKPWSEVDLFDFGNTLGRGDTMEQVAEFLCRDGRMLPSRVAESS
jgi:hypothetical protein